MATEKNKKGVSFFIYAICAFIASIFLAKPVGVLLFSITFFMGGGSVGQVRDFSQWIVNLICLPLEIFFPILRPFVGDLLAITLGLGFFYSFLFMFLLAIILWKWQNRSR
ncbi:MAG: hypothetical protein FWC50_06215 [Planctomycetaceae bacterium]|nr:hypothetical protein [Planctomycetaceae bacterium]